MNKSDVSLILWLRDAVKDRRFTQLQIAHATGVDQSQVSRILSGSAKRSSENVIALCRFAEEAQAVRLRKGKSATEKAQSLLEELMNAEPEQQALVVEILARLVALRAN